jgi:hypothetical protein
MSILILRTRFCDCTFKLSVNWHVAVILNTQLGIKKRMFFVYNFLLPLLSSCHMCHSSVFTGVAQLKYRQSPFLQHDGKA